MIIPVKTSVGEYKITLCRGAINKAGELLNLDRKVLIVTDSGVPSKYSKTVESQCKHPFIITIQQGEQSKNFDNYLYILKQMVKLEFTRKDCVVAVGGGVVGDLSGFVASTYMRGIDFYNIPTTVLSQVDSSIGGKVAVDFEGYKNIVGAFYPPKAVIIDSDTLFTLPQRQFANGLAESIKMSLTSDVNLFEIFEKENINDNIDKIIELSLKIKRYVVENDEKENGLRKILNFGHTLAHAFESENKMQQYYHGECVAIGMLPMCSKEVRNRLVAVLKKVGLPTYIDCNYEIILEAIKHDKKVAGDDITVIYVNKVGTYDMKTIPFIDFASGLKEVL